MDSKSLFLVVILFEVSDSVAVQSIRKTEYKADALLFYPLCIQERLH